MGEMGSIPLRLLQFSPDALLVVDALGIIRFSNETSSSLFGYTPEQLIGEPINLLIPERFHLRHGEHLTSYLREPSNREMGARTRDLFARRADGSEFFAGIRLAPCQDVGQKFVAVAIRDMSEHRLISDALVAAREEADRANRAKTRFLATASHDLRQPLQAIGMLNASLEKLTQQAPDLHALVCHQWQAIDRATRLLNALLDISRLESGAIEAENSSVSLAAVFTGLEDEFGPLAAAKNLRLEFMDTQMTLSTDRLLFIQLLQNLIGNAVKYTQTGHVRIFPTLDADAVSVIIEDSGMGIAEDNLGHIFNEYYQIDPHHMPRQGVGLGLAIVREVSRLLGFSIAVSSKLGDGTCFSVRIPRHRLLSEGKAPTQTPPTEAASESAHRPSRCRVVLLEDNDSVRTATQLYLSLEGFETSAAATVAEAESLFAQLRPGDVFITDYHLEGQLTGLEVLELLRTAQGRDVPCVVLSGDLQSMMRDVKTSMTGCRFLSKPVDNKELLSAIAGLIAT